MLFRPALALVFMLLPLLAAAQATLSGTVQDSVTHKPLAFASVFLANTTLGTTTTEQGTFELLHVPVGSHTVVASYVGYRLARQEVRIGPTPQRVALRLAPANQLGEVVVRPRPNRPSDYQKFVELFIGRSSFSSQCHIRNPQDVLVDYTPQTHELTAVAPKLLQIDNEALGYRIKYYGLRFRSNLAQQVVAFYGQPVFEEMTPRSEREGRQWAANRVVAYRGALTHFLKSVHDNHVKSEGFLVQKLRLVPQHHFNNADSLRALLRRERQKGLFTKAEDVPLPQWAEEPRGLAALYRAALPLDSMRRVSEDGTQVFLRFHDYLQVTYLREGPDQNYLFMAPPPGTPGLADDKQTSRVVLLAPEAEILPNGQLANPLAIYTDSYWGFEKMGEFLPINYLPPVSPPSHP